MFGLLKSLHGRELGLDRNSHLLARGLHLGAAPELNDKIILPGPDTAAIFSDFLGGAQALSTTVVNGFMSRVGSDGQCVNWTITGARNGTIVATIGDTTASMAVSGVQLDHGLSWRADMGRLRFQARVQLSQITTIAAFIGFTDQVAALEMPIHAAASANTITTNATDAVGFFFDTSMDADTWWLAGVANNTDATHQNTGFAPVAATYEVFTIDVMANGSALFYRNGLLVGSLMSGAVTPTVLLTPVIAGFNRNTSGTPTITVDYLNVSAARV